MPSWIWMRVSSSFDLTRNEEKLPVRRAYQTEEQFVVKELYYKSRTDRVLNCMWERAKHTFDSWFIFCACLKLLPAMLLVHLDCFADISCRDVCGLLDITELSHSGRSFMLDLLGSISRLVQSGTPVDRRSCHFQAQCPHRINSKHTFVHLCAPGCVGLKVRCGQVHWSGIALLRQHRSCSYLKGTLFW